MAKNNHTEAQRAAAARYDAKTYKLYAFKLRKEEDAEVIKAIADAAEKGISKREWLHDLYEQAKSK